MKDSKDPSLTRLLNARQMGLKMIANFTYGYTSASFSGRMPCIEVSGPAGEAGSMPIACLLLACAPVQASDKDAFH